MGSIPAPVHDGHPPVVVLGAAVYPDGTPSPALRRRVLHGIECFRRSNAAALILTGGRGRHPPSEARVMASLARTCGIDSDRIVLEESSHSTLDSAEACAELIQSAGWQRALVVTDRYHLPRTLSLFYCFGIRARGSAPAAASGERYGSWMILRELLAVPWNLLRLALRKIRRLLDRCN